MSPRCFLSRVGREYTQSLVEYGGIARIQIFGFSVAKRAAAESKHASLRIQNRKNRPLAEHVVDSPIPPDRNARAHELLFRKAHLKQSLCGAVAMSRSGTQPKHANGVVIHPALVQIGQHMSIFRFPKLAVKKSRALPVCIIEPVLLGTAGGILPVRNPLRQIHMHLLGQQFHRVPEIEMLHLHHEIDGASARVAAKAVIHLPFRADGKGSRFLPMKRAQAPITPAFRIQLHISGYHLDDVGPLPQLIQPCLWKPACQASSPPFSFFATVSHIPASPWHFFCLNGSSFTQFRQKTAE